MDKIRVSIITVSDSCSNGTRVDESGPRLCELVGKSAVCNAEIIRTVIIGDERELIESKLRELITLSDLVITTGGTGFSARDVTPEATLEVIERRCNGLEIALHTNSLQKTPFAALSRAVAGISGSTLIVNMPGSVKAVTECWQTLEPLVNHAIGLLKNDNNALH